MHRDRNLLVIVTSVLQSKKTLQLIASSSSIHMNTSNAQKQLCTIGLQPKKTQRNASGNEWLGYKSRQYRAHFRLDRALFQFCKLVARVSV